MNYILRKIATVCLCSGALLAFGAEIDGRPFQFPRSEGASVGVLVWSLADSGVVAEYDADRLMVPASVTKCLTSATAMLSLPDNYTFDTQVKMLGALDSVGTFRGVIAVEGGWDPTLGSRFFAGVKSLPSQVAQLLTAEGVKSVEGAIVCGLEKAPIDSVSPFWLVEDLPWEYGAPCLPLNYSDNSRVSSAGRVSVGTPARGLRRDIVEAMQSKGIKFQQSEVAADAPLWRKMTMHSPRRDDILRVMMYRSDNLFAEAMLRAPIVMYAGADRAKVTAEDALVRQRALWEGRGLDLTRARVLDGSGLAPVARLSPRQLADVLRFMAGDSAYVSLFPKAGVEGTVRRFFTDVPHDSVAQLVLKSGSMTGVLTYAGYALGSDGRPTHVVVAMVNGYSCGLTTVRRAIASWLAGLPALRVKSEE